VPQPDRHEGRQGPLPGHRTSRHPSIAEIAPSRRLHPGRTAGRWPRLQDRLAKHASFENVFCRVRQYTVAQADFEEERQRRKRAAAREFQIIQSLNHPNILPVLDYKEHELGPALLFRYLDPQRGSIRSLPGHELPQADRPSSGWTCCGRSPTPSATLIANA
jgi:hypothetical protein